MNIDAKVQLDILGALRREPDINPAGIGVIVEDGIVTLTGHVDTLLEKLVAGRAIRLVNGVKAIANDIEVQIPGGHRPTDADIARTAVAALSWDLLVPEEGIQILVSDGWVTLQGSVPFPHQQKAAEAAVSNLTGVQGVNNLITVTPEPSIAKR